MEQLTEAQKAFAVETAQILHLLAGSVAKGALRIKHNPSFALGKETGPTPTERLGSFNETGKVFIFSTGSEEETLDGLEQYLKQRRLELQAEQEEQEG